MHRLKVNSIKFLEIKFHIKCHIFADNLYKTTIALQQALKFKRFYQEKDKELKEIKQKLKKLEQQQNLEFDSESEEEYKEIKIQNKISSKGFVKIVFTILAISILTACFSR